MKRLLTILVLLSLTAGLLEAQPWRRQRDRIRAEESLKVETNEDLFPGLAKREGAIMEYIIDEKGDTILIDSVPPAWVFPKGVKKGRNWRRYTRLVYNFNKIYPYAPLVAEVIARTDSTIEAQGMDKAQRRAYINVMQKEILHDFAPVVRHMTTSQGKLLMRLVDREIGKTSYQIVKDYKNGLAAGFWQGIAKLFGQNLKDAYDPDGIDKPTEELVKKWESGQWDEFYYSIFFELPPRTKLPSKYR